MNINPVQNDPLNTPQNADLEEKKAKEKLIEIILENMRSGNRQEDSVSFDQNNEQKTSGSSNGSLNPSNKA